MTTKKNVQATAEKGSAKNSPSTDFQKELQERIDAENAQGFRGIEVDPTPNDHYSVAGVIAGKPTPETDPDHAAEIRAQLDKNRSK